MLDRDRGGSKNWLGGENMEESVINNQLKRVPNYLGSYAVDELHDLKVSYYPSFIIINLDERHGTGTHWIAVAIYQNTIYLCDSLGGINPTRTIPIQLINFLHAFTTKRKLCITKQLQPKSSGTCGLYCILFIHEMSQNHSFTEFLRFFTTDLHQNDILVKFLNKSVKL